MDQADRKSPLTLGTGLSVYATQHEKAEFQERDVLSHNVSAYLSRSGYVGASPYSVRIHGDFTNTELNGIPFSEVTELGATADLQLGEWVTLTPKYKWQSKEFEDDTDLPEYYSRDGDDQRGGADLHFYILENRLILGLGYEYRENDTEGTQFKIESHNVEASVQASLPLKLRFTGSVEFNEEDYTEYTPEPRRLDEVWTFYGVLSRKILGDEVRAEVNYTYTTSDSNLAFSDYKSSVVGVALSVSL